MRLLTIILSLFFLFTISTALCHKNQALTDTTKHAVHKLKHPKRPRPMHTLPDSLLYYNDCVFTHKYTLPQRLAKYPFNRAVKIFAVSYQNGGEPNTEIDANGHPLPRKMHKPYRLMVKNGKLNPSSLFELKQLMPEQISRLSDLMYNTDFKVHIDRSNYADPGTKCYEPRNAFLFVDKQGKVFDYIEMCFQCSGTSSKSGKIFLSVGCNQELDIAKKLLIDVGIKFGTTTKDDTNFQNLTVKW